MRRLTLLALVALAGLCTCPAPHKPAPAPVPVPASEVAPLVDPALELLVTPSPEGHQPFVRAIDDARQSIAMTMYHLTDADVVAALVRAAGRGVSVRVILDGKSLGPGQAANRRAADELRAGAVEVQASSAAFSITHVKAMVVDGAVAFVTAINLTHDADRTLDLGIVTRDRAIVADVTALFEADWDNARTGGHTTPARHAASLVVAPVDARAKLVALIASAHHDLLVTVENLGDPQIEAALAAAVGRGVTVRVIVPACDKIPDKLYDLSAAQKLGAAGVAIRMMPAPETPEQPYMHSKMILADGAVAYIGSVNFTVNSTMHARELGVIVASPSAAARIRTIFDADWRHTVPPPSARPAHCEDVTP